MRLPNNRALRGLVFGLYDLGNPWDLARVLLPGKHTIAFHLRDSIGHQTFVISPDQRRDFVRALAWRILGKDRGYSSARSELPNSSASANERLASLPQWAPLLDHFMAGQYSWDDCPYWLRMRIQELTGELAMTLGDNLVGAYAHGSLAFGCYNPRWSDIDLLCVTREPLDSAGRRSAAQSFLRYSTPPRGIEAMFIAERNLNPWVYPIPFDFYFSEKLRRTYEADLQSGAWREWFAVPRTSYMAAAHIGVMPRRGIRLTGKGIAELFPSVPEKDYLDSIMMDFRSKQSRVPATTISGVLNACRVYSFLLEHRVDSKEEAAVWAMGVLPKDDRALVRKVLDVYRGARLMRERFDNEEVVRFFADMERRFDQLMPPAS